MKKQKKDYTLFYLFMVVILGLLLMASSINLLIQETKLKVTIDLMIFQTEWLAFELDRHNITIEQSSDDFLRYKLEGLLDEK